MKKTITRISAVLILLAVGITSVIAQPSRHHHRAGYRSDGFIRGVRDVHTVASTAMLGYGIASLDDYTGIRFGYNAASLRTDGFDDVSSDVQSGASVGIVTLNDLRNIMFQPRLYERMKVADIMIGPKGKIPSDMNMAEVMNLFDTTGAWTLPVIDNQGKYVGMMSRQHLYETYRALLKQFSED